MPPLPQNGHSYPPTSSSSGYQPLSRTSEDDLESHSPSSSSSTLQGRMAQRRFVASPSSSLANDPTDLLKSFLSDTRSNPHHSQKLSLRIHVSNGKVIEVPLAELTEQDSLPYALANDIPCLRGLPTIGPLSFGDRVKGFFRLLNSTSDLGDAGEQKALQVYNKSQKRTLYATREEIVRYNERLRSGKLPPWTPLNSTASAPLHTQQQETEEEEGDEEEADVKGGDFDLGSVFARKRKRTTTRLVSIPLQEAFERFSDDRHFSKILICKRCVWGWDMSRLQRSLQSLYLEADAGKGKGRAHNSEGVEVTIEVAGMNDGPMYNVVWVPIPFLTRRCGALFNPHGSLLAISLLTGLFVGSVLLGLVANTLVLIAGALGLVGWGGMMYLIRTQNRCVYDTVGTAYSLAPRWVRIPDADPSWSHEQVVNSLKSHDGGNTPTIEKRGEEGNWFMQRGMDQDKWLQSHREQILHLLSQ
ncbi:hypothetical protein NDA11_000168 [Ustilago hordei]|uniref:Uncharacterized protein n=1 Tax=Ustilago hordei TaxID=120017 RepID=I2G287_USTHO|nr:uncharacterized protein UHO2_02558 [Ustilago hordei]KAJ1040231.1 hypothetical protein NDA10_007976 [Ustilago hordei]KAJ1592638.1 hypothetical protein NDA11_000168 [Ustilago hordei]KAJ1601290.1 hypothetical protein NDA14_001041 [Ustilago hordei]UTT93937.1 hypothetical protein NDA17_002403 [Ustilago hordei]CCF53280.1 uncharacterized protein UHOR_02735 [Ustilago hordei]